MPLFGPPNVDRLAKKRNVRGLLKAQLDSNDQVSWAATRALLKLGEAQAAIDAVVKLGPSRKALNPLLSLVRAAPELEQREAAARALIALYRSGRLTSTDMQHIMDRYDDLERNAPQAMTCMDQVHVDIRGNEDRPRHGDVGRADPGAHADQG
jgi:HEAT repeat protein